MMGRKDKKSSLKPSLRGYSGAWRTSRQKSTNPNSKCPPVPGMTSLCPLLSVSATDCNLAGNSFSKIFLKKRDIFNYWHEIWKYMSNICIDRITGYYLWPIENSLSIYVLSVGISKLTLHAMHRPSFLWHSLMYVVHVYYFITAFHIVLEFNPMYNT